MNKKITLSFLLSFVTYILPLYAQQVNNEMAKSYAYAFCTNRTQTLSRTAPASANLQLAYVGGNQLMPDYYIYNIGNNQGFVIIAGDQRMKTVLAYSLEGHFDASTMPNEFKEFLNGYSEQTELIRTDKIHKNVLSSTAQAPIVPLDEITRMTPLLDIEGIKYDQQAPYNSYCPLIQGQHALTGCGATAMAQVMRYFKYPEHGQGSHKNTNYANDSLIDFGKATYNWEQMLPAYTNKKPGTDAQRGAIALLMHHVGVSINMIYSLTGSGTSNFPLGKALKTYFKYNPDINIAYRETYTNQEWFELIKNELDNNRPVTYAGFSTSGGHLFVCDGYDSEGRLHYNYGWSGLYNAYAFPTVGDDNADATLCRYPTNNSVVIGISPEQTVVRPQIAQLSGVNLSSLTLNTGTAFNASIRISNYGYTQFSNNIKISLFRGDKEIVLKEQKVTVSPNNLTAGPDQMRTQNMVFEGLKIPAKTAAGTYQLRCMVLDDIGSNAKYYPILGQTGNTQRRADVTINGNKVTFSYPLEENGLQGQLTVSKKLEMSVNNGIGTARFTLNNPDKYNNTSNVYIVGFKDGIPNMEMFGSKTINLLPGDSQDIEIKGMRLKSGKYTYAVAFNPINPEGTWWGAVPLAPASMSYCSLEVPAEKVDYSIDLTKLTELPQDFLQYKDNKLYTVTGENDLDAPWRYYKNIQKAWSYFPLGDSKLGKSHILATNALTVTDQNEILEWTMTTTTSQAPAHYEVFVSTTGQGMEDMETSEKIYEAAVENASNVTGETVRLSLFKYAGQKVYVFFRHTMDGELSSTMGLKSIRLLNIQSPKDIAVTGISVPARAVSGEYLPIELTVNNRSPFPIKKFTATYKVGDQSYTEDIETDMPYDVPTTFTLNHAEVKGQPGEKIPVSVSVAMEEESPTLLDNNSGNASYTVMQFMPARHMVVMKTARGGCGACMASYTALDEMEEANPASFTGGVELWQPYNGQPTYPEYGCDEFSYFYSGSTPSIYMNNLGVGFQTTGDIVPHTENKLNTTSPVSDVKIEAAYVDDNSRMLNIKITSRFALPVTGKYKMGAYIIESNAPVPNYQIFGGSPSGNKRTKNHMPIGTTNGARGERGFVIENPKEGQEYVYSCQFEVPETRGKDNNTRTINRENIQVIGLVFTPNGTIDNSAINSYYIHIPKTEGLTFVAEPGYDTFKETNEVAAIATSNNFTSVIRNRATVTSGSDFRFKIVKDDAIAKKKLKVLVNKKSNKGQEVELTRDSDGAYTLKSVNQFYYLDVTVLDEEEEEPHETRSFKVTDASGQELTNGQEITINQFSKDGYDEALMHFNFSISASKEINLTLTRDDSGALPETINSICLGSQCVTAPSVSLKLAKNETASGYSTYQPGNTSGTSKIIYTFESSVRGEAPLTVTVNFEYDSKAVSIPSVSDETTTVYQMPGCKQLNIRHSSYCTITITDLAGRTLQQLVADGAGDIQTKPLAPGYYVVTVQNKQRDTYTQKVVIH